MSLRRFHHLDKRKHTPQATVRFHLKPISLAGLSQRDLSPSSEKFLKLQDLPSTD